MTDYSLRIIRGDGSIMDGPSTFQKLEYSKAINTPGALSLILLEDDNAWSKVLIEDTRIQVWREPQDWQGYIDLDATWFVTTNVTTRGDNRQQIVQVAAKSALDLADRRIVAYHAGSAQATINNKADDQMKRIITENLGASAGAGRVITGLTVAANAGQAPVVNKQIAWRGVLQTLQEIARDSETAGTPLYYDIITSGSNGLEFRTWIGQPGSIRTSPILSLEAGSLRSASWGFDRDSVTNVVYGLGPEFGGVRVVATATDSSYAATPYSRRESTVDARVAAESATPTADTQAEANAEMKRRRPKEITVAAETANNEGARYGVHWGFGDRIPVSVDGRRYTCLVEAVSVVVEQGREQIKATLRF